MVSEESLENILRTAIEYAPDDPTQTSETISIKHLA